ncbi:hybrid sensor histidine kinase/response regulator transcription factor [Paraglaciecola sp. L3A3]|uniref:hybrid sensor histidine kinase/response regulator transcription factor n=1 Tax=Paraglaciecola sp. L3A3 TaxID=2686358 RepID=UPI00131BA715|nr:hybrid sensor histidine kinase/response regulator transcription factor [Paraglaciecola sp. L3A3]
MTAAKKAMWLQKKLSIFLYHTKTLFLFLVLFVFPVAVSAENLFYPEIENNALHPEAWIEIENLPSNAIHNLTVDKNNHLWMGSFNAVLSYDGKTLTKYDVKDGLSSYAPQFYVVDIDDKGQVYALGEKQIYQFKDNKWQPFGPYLRGAKYHLWTHRKLIFAHDAFWLVSADNLIKVSENDYQYFELSGQFIEEYIVDNDGFFWVLFRDTGDVKRYRLQNDKLIELNVWPRLNKNLTESRLFQVANNQIWLLNHDKQQPPLSLDITDIKRKPTAQLNWQEQNYPSQAGYVDQVVLGTSKGEVMLVSEKGIYIKADNKWQSTPLADFKIDRKILGLKQSKDGNLWLFEFGNAIRRLNYNKPRQITYKNLIYGCKSQQNEFFLHKDGRVIRHNVLTDIWYKQTVDKGLISTATNILCTRENDIIVYGSHNKTAAISYLQNLAFSQKKQIKWQILLLPQLGENIGALSVLQSSSGDIYLGRNDESLMTEGMLVKLSRLSKESGEFTVTDIPLAKSRVASIAEFKNNQLVVSNNKLAVLNPDNLNLSQNVSLLALPEHFVYGWVEGTASDLNDNIWMANWHYGVLSYNGTKWRQYSLNEGLSSEKVSTILAPKDGRVLALTSTGVDWFDGTTWQNMDIYNARAIREGSNLVAADDNTLWVNQASRDWVFRFQQIKMNFKWYFQLQGDVFETIKYSPSKLAPLITVSLESSIDNYQNAVLLSWRGKDQWYETPSSKLKYSYRLNQDKWSVFSSDTSHYFTNLSAGDYSVEVRARDGDGNISLTPATISFTILAPFWQQTWFYIIMASLFVLMFIVLLMLIVQRLKQTSRMNEVRMQFLTNISHELRNPLSLIISPLDEFFNQHAKAKDNYGLQLALRNAKRLKQLIEQLLQYRRLQTGQLALNNQLQDFVLMVRLLVEDLAFIAKSKDQQIVLETKLSCYLCEFDQDVVRKIIENLITNAIKYSPENSIISVRILKSKSLQGMSVHIEDQGLGLPAAEIKTIFEPFYTQKEHRFANNNSFGIGLALVKDLVTLCQGNISVISPPEGKSVGSLFVVNFDHFIEVNNGDTEIQVLVLDKQADTDSTINAPINTCTAQKEADNRDNPIHLLIVDDNVELANYLQLELSNNFICHVEYDGKQALTYARSNVPDVIVSDYKMPNMDGLDLCQALKNDIVTSHIPVLLHTAMIAEEHQLKGFAFGAVDYLLKPVSLPILKNRIKSLMKNRQHYASFLQKSLQALPIANSADQPKTEENTFSLVNRSANSLTNILDGTITAQEEKFLLLVNQKLLENFHTTEFNAEQLAGHVHMSRSAFYRKFNALTNITPAEYIKRHRLTTAKQLLQDGYSVSAIISKVGYSDSSSFNRAFKNYFGHNPSEQNSTR